MMRHLTTLLAAGAVAVGLSAIAAPAQAHGHGHGHGHDCDTTGVARGHHECPPPPVEPPTPPPAVIPTGWNLIIGSPSPDRLPGTLGRDAIFAFGSNDALIGRDGVDRLYGMRGNDRLRGGVLDGDRDVMNGGQGRDVCVGSPLDVYRSCEIRIVL